MSSLTEQQRAARAKGLGGSDAAVVCGFSPWKTPVQLWQEKTGRVPEENLDDNELVQMGIILEDVIADTWAKRNGMKIARVNQTLVHPKLPYVVGNIDRRIVGRKAGLECKNAAEFTFRLWGEEGSDDVPQYYLTQCVHYMAVTGWREWYVAPLIGGNKLRSYVVHHDQEIEDQLLAIEAAFWECVEKDTPPPPLKIDDLSRLYPESKGSIVATEEIGIAIAEYARLKEQEKAIDERLTAIKLEVGKYMGEYGDLIDPHDGMTTIATYRAQKSSRVCAKDKLIAGLSPLLVDLARVVVGEHDDPAAIAETIDSAGGVEAWAASCVAQFINQSTSKRFLVK